MPSNATGTSAAATRVKPGRNDACPCGSGKKYKRCCGQEPAAALSATAAPAPAVAVSPAVPVRPGAPVRPAAALRVGTAQPHEIATLVAMVSQGLFNAAEERARRLAGVHPDDGMLWKILGVALLRQGKDAVPALLKTAALMPQDAEAHGNLGSALHDQGRWTEALASLRRALEIRPHDIDALIDAASASRASGHIEDAVTFYQRALAINPRLHAAHNDLGNALLELKMPEDAIRCYRLALALEPAAAAIHSNLGNALRQLGRMEEAIESSRQAIALDPTIGQSHNTLGIALAARGRLEEAVASYRRALALDAGDVEALNNLGNALRDLGELRVAVGCLRQAVELQPTRAVSHHNLGNALLDIGHIDEAAASYERALQLKPAEGIVRLHLSMALRRQGRATEAEANCRLALADSPASAEALSFLGELCADRGEFAQAEELFRRAIAIKPDFPDPWVGIAGHRKMAIEDTEWLRGTLRLVATRLPLRQEINLRYALGKYFDDVSDYERAFDNYRQANELSKRCHSIYHRARLIQRVDEIKERFDKGKIEQHHVGGNPAERPVFIVGMPRSGTTLAEQILASHPAVFGAGELIFWDKAFARETTALPDIAREYLERLSALSGNALRVVDKMPANFMNLGLIHTAFPRARIIHMQRHPVDTCLSIYFQYFSDTHPYANDLDDLAHYYGEYSRIMDHWRAVLPPSTLLEVPYEALVMEQEDWSRRMVDFIGLPWDANCLDFHRTRRTVITTSKWQVRQKIHSASAGRWRNYERHVGPLRRLLS
jgi:tetratricopeptide (TPR) repeat protein